MTVANWKTLSYKDIQSLLFNNPHRVIRYLVHDGEGIERLHEAQAGTVKQ